MRRPACARAGARHRRRHPRRSSGAGASSGPQNLGVSRGEPERPRSAERARRDDHRRPHQACSRVRPSTARCRSASDYPDRRADAAATALGEASSPLHWQAGRRGRDRGVARSAAHGGRGARSARRGGASHAGGAAGVPAARPAPLPGRRQLLLLSVYDGRRAHRLAPYRQLFASSVYVDVLLITLKISALDDAAAR